MRVNKTFTIGANPINVVTGTTSAPSASSPPEYATRLFVQMLTGGSGLGYLLDGITVGRVPAATPAADDITAELPAATSTTPGGSYSDQDFTGEGGIDLRRVWIHGAHAGDPIKVSFDQKV